MFTGLLNDVAAISQPAAEWLAENYGGTYIYVSQMSNIATRNEQIRKERRTMSPARLALKHKISIRTVRRILHGGLRGD